MYTSTENNWGVRSKMDNFVGNFGNIRLLIDWDTNTTNIIIIIDFESTRLKLEVFYKKKEEHNPV